MARRRRRTRELAPRLCSRQNMATKGLFSRSRSRWGLEALGHRCLVVVCSFCASNKQEAQGESFISGYFRSLSFS